MLRRKKSPSPAEGDGATAALREAALTTSPAELGFSGHGSEVYGVLMESHAGAAVVSLVSFADGTTSLYFSTGGGTIGAGANESVAAATHAFIVAAGELVAQAEPSSDFPTPADGEVRFQFLTFDGGRTAAALEDDLGNQRSPLSPLFFAGHDVISAIRIMQQGPDEVDALT